MSDDRGPIFIGGLANSGKTPLRIVLGAHPEISFTRHTHLWDRYFGRFGELTRPENLDRCLSAILADEAVRRLHPDPVRIRCELEEGPATYARLFELLHRHQAERLGKRRWGEQLGSVERFADPIFAAFPSASMVHMIRDPRTRYAAGTASRRRRGEVGWETAKWLHSAHLAERNRRRYPGHYRVVRYETLAAEPLGTVRELCSFLDEEYDPDMDRALTGIRFDSDVAAGSTEAERSRVGGSPTETAFVDRYTRQELPAFGYRPTNETLPRLGRVSFELLERPLNRVTMAAWRVACGRPATKRAAGAW